jgi:hypothetical protein
VKLAGFEPTILLLSRVWLSKRGGSAKILIPITASTLL